MTQIEAVGLTKIFRVAAKPPGLKGALRHLVRPVYEEKTAVAGIDLRIGNGESVAYVGPNGAGKSTTVKMLTGILVPTRGRVRVMGKDPHRNRIENARQIGVVFGQRTQLWWDIPIQESFRLLGDIYDVPQAEFSRNMDELIELLDLGPLLARPARQLSLGQRMRCDLAASLLHAPPILYLDEPTIGLDVAVKERVRRFIRERNVEKGVTVMLTSHDLSDVEGICRRIVMIDRGRIVFDGPVGRVREQFGQERSVHLVFGRPIPDAVAQAEALLKAFVKIRLEQSAPNRLSVRFDATVSSTGEVAAALLPAFPVSDLQIEETNIEAIIRRLYEGELSVEEAG